MLDKKANQKSMRDMMIKDGYDPAKKQFEKAQASVHAFKYSHEYYDAIINYNSQLQVINPLYGGVTPMSKVLVRPYLIEPQITESGLVLPYKQTIPVPTNSGAAKYADIESDFPFSPKAVVVSVPTGNTTLKPGDVVFLSRKAIQMIVLGTGANAELRVENAFIHPDSKMFDLTKDVTNQHYGYIMVDYHLIDAKIA